MKVAERRALPALGFGLGRGSGDRDVDVKEEAILGERIADHWYYASKGRALKQFVHRLARGSILDVGAGSGVFSKILLDDGWRDAVCVDPGYETERTVSHGGKPIRFVRAIDRAAADLVLMMDVCEHVDDDVGLIRTYAGAVPGGTHFFISVPAFQFLYSAHDLFLDHRRRYTLAGLEATIDKAGLERLSAAYYFAAVFPIAAAQRLVEKFLVGARAMKPKSSLRRHSRPLNLALKALCACELPLLGANRLFGLSALCLARKPR